MIEVLTRSSCSRHGSSLNGKFFFQRLPQLVERTWRRSGYAWRQQPQCETVRLYVCSPLTLCSAAAAAAAAAAAQRRHTHTEHCTLHNPVQ